MRDITIVTAFFDIGRGDWKGVKNGRPMENYLARSNDYYFECFERLAKVKNDMIIYTSPEFKQRIEDIRASHSPDARTVVIELDLYETLRGTKEVIQNVMLRPEYVLFVDNPQLPEYWNPEYVLINFLKTDFVCSSFEQDLIKTELAAWIDFGYARNADTVPDNMLWQYDFDPAFMHFFNLRELDNDRPLFDIVKTNSVYIMGCHAVGGKEAWTTNMQLNYSSLNMLLNCGLIDDDQTIMLMNVRAAPEKYKLHPIDVEQNGWHVIFQKFSS